MILTWHFTWRATASRLSQNIDTHRNSAFWSQLRTEGGTRSLASGDRVMSTTAGGPRIRGACDYKPGHERPWRSLAFLPRGDVPRQPLSRGRVRMVRFAGGFDPLALFSKSVPWPQGTVALHRILPEGLGWTIEITRLLLRRARFESPLRINASINWSRFPRSSPGLDGASPSIDPISSYFMSLKRLRRSFSIRTARPPC